MARSITEKKLPRWKRRQRSRRLVKRMVKSFIQQPLRTRQRLISKMMRKLRIPRRLTAKLRIPRRLMPKQLKVVFLRHRHRL